MSAFKKYKVTLCTSISDSRIPDNARAMNCCTISRVFKRFMSKNLSQIDLLKIEYYGNGRDRFSSILVRVLGKEVQEQIREKNGAFTPNYKAGNRLEVGVILQWWFK